MTLPLFPSYREINLTRGQVAIVDAEDFERISDFKWQAHLSKSNGAYYAARTQWAGGRKLFVSMHREVLGLVFGDGLHGDHKNGNTLDNRRSNLRCSTQGQNNLNTKKRSDNSTGYKGVCRRGSRYIAQIQIDGKKKHIGMGNTAEEAYAMYCKAAQELHGEFARLS